MPTTNAYGGEFAGSETLICPKCASPMEKVMFGSTEVDRCETCGGVWFDRGEKEALAELTGSEVVDAKADRGATTPGDVREMKCPRCQGPMVTTEDPERPGVEFEICQGGDGAFFDAGEFKDYKQDGLLASLSNAWRSVWDRGEE